MSNPCCPILLSSFTTRSMTLPVGKACVGSVCLKYLIICLANALLATGWLLLSVLTLISNAVLAFGSPPTLPKPPAHPTPLTIKPVLASSDMERIKLDRANSLEKHAQAQHVKFVNGRSTSHASPPSPISTVASSSTLPDSNAHGSDTALVSTSPISTSPTLPSPSSEKSHQPNAQGHKRLSFRRSSGRSTSSGDSGSSERPAHGVGPCLLLKRATSGLDFPHHQSPRQKSPVRRTDPYQAPYFFPSPLSPDAAGYAQRLRIERGGSGSPDTTLAALSLTSSPLASVPSSQYGLEARRDGSSAQGSSDPVRRNSTKRPQPLPLANVRNRPLSWDSDIRHLRTKKSASSMQSVETPSTATPGKKFWRKPTKTHHAHLVALNTVANLERLPDSLTSPPTTAKQKRTWFRRRHTMSVSDLPSPATLTGELSRQSRNVGDAAVVS